MPRPGKRQKTGHIEGNVYDLAKSPQAAKIALAWALPDDVDPVRMRNEYSSGKTAVAKLFEEHKPWAGADGTNEQLLTSTQLEFIFQDMLKNRVSYVRNTGDQITQYAWRFGRDPTSGVDTAAYTIKKGDEDWLPVTHATTSSGFKPHGDILFAEKDYDTGISGLQVDSGPNAAKASSITVTCAPVPAVDQGEVILYKYVSGDWQVVDKKDITIASAGVFVFAIPTSVMAVHAIKVSNADQDESFSVFTQMQCGVYGHFPAPSSVSNMNSIEAVRCLGHSIRMMNVAAPQYQEGAICAYQPGKGKDWRTFCPTNGTADPYGFVRDNQGASPSKPAKTGFYTFVKPTEEKDIEMRTPLEIAALSPGNNVWTYAATPIAGIPYVVVCAQINGDPLGRDMVVRTVQHLEFATANQFFNVAPPVSSPAEWRDGMEALASLDQYYENPVHWKKILSTLGATAAIAGNVISRIFPAAGAIAGPIAQIGEIVHSATSEG